MFEEMNSLVSVDDVAAKINAGLGVDVDAFQASEVTLVSLLIDDSGSIRYGRTPSGAVDLSQAVIMGHNAVIDALLGSKGAGTILFYSALLNGRLINPYVALQDAKRLDDSNYSADGITPLYDQTVVFGGTIAKKTEDFQNAGVVVKTISLIITDGKDEGSVRNDINDVRTVVESLLSSETAVFGGYGIGTLGFEKIFKAMGIRDDAIMVSGISEKEIRAKCHQFSQSAIRVSQTTGALGGLV